MRCGNACVAGLNDVQADPRWAISAGACDRGCERFDLPLTPTQMSRRTTKTEVTTNYRDGAATISVRGEIDMATAARLEEPLGAAIERGVPTVVIDLSGCEFLDSSTLSLLVRAHRDLAARGRRLSLVVPPTKAIRSIFVFAQLDGLLEIEPDWEAARRGPVSGPPLVADPHLRDGARPIATDGALEPAPAACIEPDGPASSRRSP